MLKFIFNKCLEAIKRLFQYTCFANKLQEFVFLDQVTEHEIKNVHDEIQPFFVHMILHLLKQYKLIVNKYLYHSITFLYSLICIMQTSNLQVVKDYFRTTNP